MSQRYTPEQSEAYRITKYGINCEQTKEHMTKALKHNSPSQEKPIAIFIVGPPGSGKTHLLENNLLPRSFEFDYYNVDEYYEPLLKIKEYGHSIHNLMKLAKECIKIDYDDMLKNRKNIVLDRAGGRAYSILHQKKELENEGYKTYMIAVYTPSNLSVTRDQNRRRTLGKEMVNNLWKDVIGQLLYYKKQFGDEHFILMDNSEGIQQELPHPEIKSYNEYNIKVTNENDNLLFKFARSQKIKGFIPLLSIEDAKKAIETFLLE